MEHYKLTLNHDLIDPNFSSYKLYHEALPTYTRTLEAGIDSRQLVSNEFFSHQHVKAFGIQNQLFLDPWNDESLWFVDDKWNVKKVQMEKGPSEFGSWTYFSIPNSSERQLVPDRVNVTLHFTSPSWCVIADGTGRLYILKTGDRKQDGQWKDIYGGQPLGEDSQFIIFHSASSTIDKICYVDILCLKVEKRPEQPDKSSNNSLTSAFVTNLEWLTFTSADENSFVVSRTRTLQSPEVPEYGVIQGTSVIVAAEKPVRFVRDSLNPVDESIVEDVDQQEKPPAYVWSQNADSVTVIFKLSPEVQKSNVSCKIETKNIDIRIVESELPMLSGELDAAIKTDESTWLINDEHMLELHLAKAVSDEAWARVVEGDDCGQFVLDPDQLAEISERLAPYTSDVLNPDPDGSKKAFNVQQLEECDAFPEDSVAIWQLDGETHDIIQKVDISSNQWLFTGASNGGQLPPVCLRHDVDGIIWQPELTESGALIWKHASTFNAFGYVQASKRERKFTVHAPDYSYVAVVEFTRHVFIYRQPAPLVSPLRNRKTGETVGSVAKQHVISLETLDPILGVQATNKKIFILAGKTVYAIRINED